LRILPLLAAAIGVVCVLSGCQSSAPASSSRNFAPYRRNNAYSLLYQLLDEEKDVSLLRFIKHEPSDVKTLVNKIAAASKEGEEKLEELAKEDPTLNLRETDLPPGEVATRAAIAAAKKKEILAHSGDPFDLALLLSQAEALNYGWHLAMVASQDERQPSHLRALAALEEKMMSLYQEVFELLLSKTELSWTKPAGVPARLTGP
jgi:outer membrane murein-binding lipoprotein Lpp